LLLNSERLPAIDGTAASVWMSIVSKATVATIGLASKLFLNSGYCSSVKVNGMHNLLNELGRKDGRGVITGVFLCSWGFFLSY
jgi:hypothetical protein